MNVRAAPQLASGDVLAGKLRVERLVAFGAMGDVYEAVDTTLGRRVAVKLIAPELGDEHGFRARFEREARAAASLTSSHVVKVLETGVSDGTPYLVMELLSGRSLEAIIERDGAVPPDVAVDWILQALDAITEAHDHGLVHRDLKPANLFLADRGPSKSPILKVLDFGVVKLTDPSVTQLTATGATMGTPAYMAPELVRARGDIDARADVWALGVTLYELVTGRLPFSSRVVPNLLGQILHEEPAPLDAHVPAPLAAVIRRCLVKEPGGRYANGAALGRALAAAAAGAPAAAAGGTMPLAPLAPHTPSAGAIPAGAGAIPARSVSVRDAAASDRNAATVLRERPPKTAPRRTHVFLVAAGGAIVGGGAFLALVLLLNRPAAVPVSTPGPIGIDAATIFAPSGQPTLIQVDDASRNTAFETWVEGLRPGIDACRATAGPCLTFVIVVPAKGRAELLGAGGWGPQGSCTSVHADCILDLLTQEGPRPKVACDEGPTAGTCSPGLSAIYR